MRNCILHGMGNEVEAKYRVADFAVIKSRLRRCGAEFLGSVRQTDQFFDDSGDSLRGRGCGLRVRSVKVLRRGVGGVRLAGKAADFHATITFKGSVAENVSVKVREEIETRVESPAAAADILAALGFYPTTSICKRRSSYRLGRARVELDELELLGTFVEIEGVSARNVETVRKRLKISGSHIPDSYLGMTLAARRGIVV